MKRLIGISTGLVLLVAGSGVMEAHAAVHHRHGAPASLQTRVNFRLQVSGAPDVSSTFWIAYGPVLGRFAVRQLTLAGNGLYEAQEQLPLGARTSFAYIQGHGVLRTRAGLEPGGPVATIQVIGPLRISPSALPLVRWSAPTG